MTEFIDATGQWIGEVAPPAAADLHEAQGRTGALPAAIKPIDRDMTVWGFAYPVRVPPVDNLWLHRGIYAAPAGSVLVVKQNEPADAGYWGEITTEASLARGLKGLVFDGGVRDAATLVNLPFPVFAAQLCIQGTGKDPEGDGSIGEPIQFGSVEVNAGDLVVGDVDGVVVVPRDDADRVIEAALARIEKERQMVADLRAGASTLDLLGLR